MTNDKYNLKSKTDANLLKWLTEQTPGSEEYIAGEEESIRRIVIIEEKIEKAEAPIRKREFIVVSIAIVTLAFTIIAIVLSY